MRIGLRKAVIDSVTIGHSVADYHLLLDRFFSDCITNLMMRRNAHGNPRTPTPLFDEQTVFDEKSETSTPLPDAS